MAKIILLIATLVLASSFDAMSFHGNYMKKLSRATDREDLNENYQCPKYVCDSGMNSGLCVEWEK